MSGGPSLKESRLKVGNACHPSVQILLSASLLSKNIKDQGMLSSNYTCCFILV